MLRSEPCSGGHAFRLEPDDDLDTSTAGMVADRPQAVRKTVWPAIHFPGTRPGPAFFRSPDIPAPVPAPKTPQPLPPRAAPPPEQVDAGWRTWVSKQRRLLLAPALGFLAGLFVFAMLGPEEAPAPQTGADAGQQRAAKRESMRARAPFERPTTASTRDRPTPPAGYEAPVGLGNAYAPSITIVPDAYQTYPGAGYRSTVPGEQYEPDRYRPITPADEAYPADRWPSPQGRSAQRTFKQPMGSAQSGAERPWGSVDSRRREYPGQPQPAYPDYPPLIDPYAPLPDYTGSAAEPWRPGDYYPQSRSAPY